MVLQLQAHTSSTVTQTFAWPHSHGSCGLHNSNDLEQKSQLPSARLRSALDFLCISVHASLLYCPYGLWDAAHTLHTQSHLHLASLVRSLIAPISALSEQHPIACFTALSHIAISFPTIEVIKQAQTRPFTQG